MAQTGTIDYDKLATAIINQFAARLGSHDGTVVNVNVSTGSDDSDAGEAADTDSAIDKMTLKELREELVERGYPKADVSKADKESLIETLKAEMANDEDSDDESDDEDEDADGTEETEDSDEEDEDEPEDDEDDESDEEEGYTREELEAMSLRELKALAKEAEFTTADLRGLDQDGIVDLLLGETDEEEPEDDEEDEDDDEEESDELTYDDIVAMSAADRRALAKEYGVTVKRGASAEDVASAILEAAGDE